jgi:hypothetical protein
MPSTIDQDRLVAVGDKRWYLETPVATVPQAPVQQNDGRAFTVDTHPDAGAVVRDEARLPRLQIERRAMFGEGCQFVISIFQWRSCNFLTAELLELLACVVA